MPLTLYVDTERWRRHHAAILEAYPGLIPVMKGNGYGFGNIRLAAEAQRMGTDMVAVGTAEEAATISDHFAGDVLVLTPYLIGEDSVLLPDRVIRTVASVDAARALAGRRVVVDCMTSLRRHGVTEEDLVKLRTALDDIDLAGFAVHLPIDHVGGAGPVAEVSAWVERLAAARMPLETMFVSHLSSQEIVELNRRHPQVQFRVRLGTSLWLGDHGALNSKGTVLDVHRVQRGERYGYRQRKAPGAGYLLVVAGGTAQGVGLEAPKALRGFAPRAKGVARAGLATMNRTLSPFSWAGRQRWFAEPPHMQVSLLFLPVDVAPPAVGDELDVELRHTTTHFDRVVDR